MLDATPQMSVRPISSAIQELSLLNNQKRLLEQIQQALRMLDDGTYGFCENCGRPIGKLRLAAFPRATMCVSCKQRQERR